MRERAEGVTLNARFLGAAVSGLLVSLPCTSRGEDAAHLQAESRAALASQTWLHRGLSA